MKVLLIGIITGIGITAFIRYSYRRIRKMLLRRSLKDDKRSLLLFERYYNKFPSGRRCSLCKKILPITKFRLTERCIYSRCKECVKKYDRNYSKNYTKSERVKEHRREWYQKNRRERRKYRKEWYWKNRERMLEYRRSYYKDNSDKYKEYTKKYCDKNKDQIKKNSKAYYERKKKGIKNKDA